MMNFKSRTVEPSKVADGSHKRSCYLCAESEICDLHWKIEFECVLEAAPSQPITEVHVTQVTPHYSALRPPLPSSILASFFPQRRANAPPSSFKTSSSLAVSSNDPRSARRVSRTPEDFEAALRQEGTVQLKEGPDISLLGADATSPSPAKAAFTRVPTTPGVIPPTPSPMASTSKARSPPVSPSPQLDLSVDPNDTSFQTKRRSMYRSTGIASSPDLATLVRKTKEKEREREKSANTSSSGGRPTNSDSMSASSSNLLMPSSSSSPRNRPRSSTGSAYTFVNKDDVEQSGRKTRSRTTPVQTLSPATSDWVMASPGEPKPKQTVRSKTSAFFSRLTLRSSSRSTPSTPVASSSSSSNHFPDAVNSPVPPLPSEFRKAMGNPSKSPSGEGEDVFSSGGESWRPDVLKPLPPIVRGSKTSEEDRSLVFVDKPSTSARPPTDVPKDQWHSRRRSRSVGDAELSALVASNSPRKRKESIPQSEWKRLITGFDEPVSSLELSDPANATVRARSNTVDAIPLSSLNANTNGVRKRSDTLETLSSADHGVLGSLQRSPSSPPPSAGASRPEFARAESSPTKSKGKIPKALTLRPVTADASLRSPTFASNSAPTSANPEGLSASTFKPPPRRTSLEGRLTQPRSLTASSEPTLSNVPSTPEGSRTVRLVGTHSGSPVITLPEEDIESRAKERARQIWDEDEEFLRKERVAEWLGGFQDLNRLALRFYMDRFDFSNMRLDQAFRRLCGKLYLRAETQQVDRILEQFSRKYWECNPSSVSGSANVVHAVSYSLLLLNTDLHIADITSRMSRLQFVRNTMSTIQLQTTSQERNTDSTPDLTRDDGSSMQGSSVHVPSVQSGSIRDVQGGDTIKGGETIKAGSQRDGGETVKRSKRSGSIASWNSAMRSDIFPPPPGEKDSGDVTPANGSTVSVAEKKSWSVGSRAWEVEMENMLKEMYNSTKSQPIMQPMHGNMSNERMSTSSLSPGYGVHRQRSARVGQADRLNTLKRGSIRGIQSLLSAQGTSPYSSNSSVDGRISPSPSFATSFEGLTPSSSSLFATPALGFASNLSNTIIRETQEDDDRSAHSDETMSTNVSIVDEELALLGPPWAKEGMLCRKQYWETSQKRAKDKNWMDVFVVIQKGELNMFTFGARGVSGGSVVGGGNWLANANSAGSVGLSHSLAHVLPPPGYNRQRPYCFVLTLCTGAVYFFQAGTEDLVNEWVSTCNYWAARQSREPLQGGVSNMEYGWNRVLGDEPPPTPAGEEPTDTVSMRSGKSRTMRSMHSPNSDRVIINEWKPPMQPSMPSPHEEEAQLEALLRHVSSLKEELAEHNELRQPMMALYHPRSANATKALANWERKSQHLLTEIVKYESYVESLRSGMALRLKKRGEKALEKAIGKVNQDETGGEKTLRGKWRGYPEGETIDEMDEPLTPGPTDGFPKR